MNWIKWQKGFAKKPKVWQTARLAGISIPEAVVAWFALWEWADDLTTDGQIGGVTESDVDTLVGIPGFAAAGQKVGWLLFDNEGVLLSDFTDHNGESTKKRVEDAKRKSDARRERGL